MSEQRRPVHPREPAEGADEAVEKAGDPSNPEMADDASEEKRSAHPEEPAEGGEDQVDNG